jgi:hypothetical protein
MGPRSGLIGEPPVGLRTQFCVQPLSVDAASPNWCGRRCVRCQEVAIPASHKGFGPPDGASTSYPTDVEIAFQETTYSP